ncbi:RAD3-like DEAD/DEAH box helicase [Rhizobium sp. PP-WC-2G-219]|nr:RAD3-like DEAD/DEAH box helicase [Rhizobium sp. PP-WC-2G-219]
MSGESAFLINVLDVVEQKEARLLNWGLVDSYLTAGELHAIVNPLLDEPSSAGLSYFSATDVIAALIDRALLFNFGDEVTPRYRSRMAEAVRLTFRLRQLFPRHQGPMAWQAAPTLVADFRFLWRRRRYPERDLTTDVVMAAIDVSSPDPVARRALVTLLHSYGDRLRLANFQVEATARIMSGLSGRSVGTLVSAGTGSGKTLAFYLPALSRVAAHIESDPSEVRWVKILALYPRNELLKDQFAEVYSQARRLDTTLLAKGRRKILIGTFFGPTPSSASYAHESRSGWHQTGGGLVCEYIRCPTPDCTGDMVWRDEDRHARRERLGCSICGTAIESDEVILTRERLETESPDILFTTTEMLNQRLGDGRFRHLFGIGDRATRPVEMMLLDEVHTYASFSGAQVAFLLRRWRWLLGQPVAFVGLSATLKDGERFFARLTGLPEDACREITPARSEMISEGAEYLLALRGDPVSRTALLSTTIQTSMLISRILDEPSLRKSDGIIGERLFVFTDDIDVTNRMYFSVLDAEGRDRNGAPDLRGKPRGGLATLRFPMAVEARQLDGQDWRAVTEIGHTLQAQDRKAVGRVMSMDPGVGNNLDVIVATAALEVGFNDPRVGAVIQHKAPRDVAQFLQRKGRAGRSRQMRPWTIAVLSDYGRDRIAYQSYDLLFDPELPARSLPTNNRYVLRIQAVYATFDYLSLSFGTDRASVWQDLAVPVDRSNARDRQRRLARVLQRILTSPSELDRYVDFLCRSLRVEIHEILAVLWEKPRPLLTEVIPTAVRRLESNWLWRGREGGDIWRRNSPLPEFVPENLFSSLNLPEVLIRLPPPIRPGDDDVMAMPIGQAMRDFAPGRVSRRFGLRDARERHWIAPQLDAALEQSVRLEDIATVDPIGNWLIEVSGNVARVPVYRPRQFLVTVPPPTVVDSSNARLRWCSQIVARTVGQVFAMPRGTGWATLVEELQFFTHQSHCPIDVRRMALGSDANIQYEDGTSTRKQFSFQNNDEPSALGFSISVDALLLRLELPENLWSHLGSSETPLYRALRTAYFHHQARHGQQLALVDNVFARDWLAHLLIATLTNEAIAKSIDIESAAVNLQSGQANLDLDQTLNILFQSPIVDDANAQGNMQDRLRQELAAHLSDPALVSNLLSLSSFLHQPADASWEIWLRQRFAATIASATLHVIQSLCPDIDTADLIVDIDPGPREENDVFAGHPPSEVWISELSPGGNGQIEEIQRVYSDDPRRFFTLMTAALRDNDFSLTDFQLQRFLMQSVEQSDDTSLATVLRTMRAATGVDETHEAFTELRHVLADQGYITSHAFIVALANRVLRPGSSTDTDRFLFEAVRLWEDQESRLGVELDARVVAYQLSRSDELDTALGSIGINAPSINPEHWRYNAIYGLLWPRGAHIRQAGLALYSGFCELPAPEPLLVRPFLPEAALTIDLSDPAWREQCLEQLAQNGAVTLVCLLSQSALLADALSFLATNPVQSEYLSVFARTQAIRRVGNRLEADVDIAEALQ